MSWMERLYETYERNAAHLDPVAHIPQQAHIEITIDVEGHFRRAAIVSKEDCTTLVPCTEESGGRSGKKPTNHPLCDKLQYVGGDFADFGGEVTSGFASNPKEPCEMFSRALRDWANSAESHPKVRAVLAYVERCKVVDDLVRSGILPRDSSGKLRKEWEVGADQAPPIFRVLSNPETAFVRWRIEEGGELATGTWEDPTLQAAWVNRYAALQEKRGLCMVTGNESTLAVQHPAKLRNAGDKAKLISANDTSGFTFRGRFRDGTEACSVGFEVTQKAHIALRWLIAKQGRKDGDQVVVSWCVSGRSIPDPFANSHELFEAAEARLGSLAQPESDAGQAFARRLNRAIGGYREALGAADDVVVMVLDSSSPERGGSPAWTGRLAMPFYRELSGSELLDRVRRWHEQFSWDQNFGKELRFTGAPAPGDIAEAAYGRGLDAKLRAATVERLLPCIIDGRPLPRDLALSTARRAFKRAGLEPWDWEKTLGIACSLHRGFHSDRRYSMTLELDRTSRDYLYGRLLAIAERMESMALYVAGENRETMSSRLMQRFADRPATTWRSIELALSPYKARLRANRAGFLWKIEERLDGVMSSFGAEEFADDRSLSPEFLLGYHCEREALKSRKNDGEADEEAEINDSSEEGN